MSYVVPAERARCMRTCTPPKARGSVTLPRTRTSLTPQRARGSCTPPRPRGSSAVAPSGPQCTPPRSRGSNAAFSSVAPNAINLLGHSTPPRSRGSSGAFPIGSRSTGKSILAKNAGTTARQDAENRNFISEKDLLPAHILLCLLAESEQRSRDLEDSLASARYRISQQAFEKVPEQMLHEAVAVAVSDFTAPAATNGLQSLTLSNSAERTPPSEKSFDSLSVGGSSCSSAYPASLVQVSGVKAALLQLEPMVGTELLWGHLGTLVEEIASLRLQIAEQSKRNKMLTKEVERQRELGAQIADLEKQNKLFSERIPKGVALLRQSDHRLLHKAAPDDVYMDGLLAKEEIDLARLHWEGHRMMCEDLRTARCRRRTRYEEEAQDRETAAQLRRRIEETQRAIEAAKARIKAMEAAKAKVIETIGDETPLLARSTSKSAAASTAVTRQGLSCGGVFARYEPPLR